jgi:catechol 2,3-dioxygenase-like lactoylglutathione lyase family enzyme
MSTRHQLTGLALGAALTAAIATSPAAKDSTLSALDYIEIQQLVNRYAFAIDNCTNNGYDYADLYTPDGVFYWGVGSRKSVGREQLAEAAGGGKNGCRKLEQATAENPIATHTTVNLIIEPSPEGATGKSYLVYPGVLGTHADPTHSGHVGGYQDVYVKTEKGWRFKSRLHVFPPDIPGTVDIEKTYGPPTGEVVGSSGTVSPIVSSLEATTNFYVGLLGLKSDTPTIASAKDTPPSPILRLEGTPDGRMRWNHVPYPGSGWRSEFLEFSEIDRAPVHARIQDPGTATVILQVRDVDALLAKLRQAGTSVLTPGAAPVTMQAPTGAYRAVIVADPDGHFVELRQPALVPSNAPAGDVIGGHVRIAIADTDATMRLYRDQLGFAPRLGAFTTDKMFAALIGLDNAQYRMASATVPGRPELTLEFIEFRNVDRRPLRSRIQDPGSVRLSFNVRDLDSAVAKFTNAGGAVVTTGGKPVSLGQGAPYILVRDLNNFYIILRQQAAPQ